MQKGYITASELADYIYCECCWADRIEGKKMTTPEMEDGAIVHERIQTNYFLISLLRKIALVMILVSIITFIAILFLSAKGIIQI